MSNTFALWERASGGATGPYTKRRGGVKRHDGRSKKRGNPIVVKSFFDSVVVDRVEGLLPVKEQHIERGAGGFEHLLNSP